MPFPGPLINQALEDAPKTKKIRIIHIGGAACATYAAIRVQGLARGHKAMENVELICYDKVGLLEDVPCDGLTFILLCRTRCTAELGL